MKNIWLLLCLLTLQPSITLHASSGSYHEAEPVQGADLETLPEGADLETLPEGADLETLPEGITHRGTGAPVIGSYFFEDDDTAAALTAASTSDGGGGSGWEHPIPAPLTALTFASDGAEDNTQYTRKIQQCGMIIDGTPCTYELTTRPKFRAHLNGKKHRSKLTDDELEELLDNAFPPTIREYKKAKDCTDRDGYTICDNGKIAAKTCTIPLAKNGKPCRYQISTRALYAGHLITEKHNIPKGSTELKDLLDKEFPPEEHLATRKKPATRKRNRAKDSSGEAAPAAQEARLDANPADTAPGVVPAALKTPEASMGTFDPDASFPGLPENMWCI